MLFMHQIKSKVENISLSIDELIASPLLDPRLKATHLKTIQHLHDDIEDLDDMLYLFGDKSEHPLDYFTSYDLNTCQTHLSALIDLLENSENEEDLDIAIQTRLDSLDHTWNADYLNNFTLWFKSLMGEGLVICKDNLVFRDENEAGAFLEMIQNTLQAESVLFSQEYGENRAMRALSQSRMLYGDNLTTSSQPYTMRIASEKGNVVNLLAAKDQESVIDSLGWQIKSPKAWNAQRYLTYKSRSRAEKEEKEQKEQIQISLKNPLQFSPIYKQTTNPPPINMPELPLGIALACAQKLIDDAYIAEKEVFLETGRFGVLTESNLSQNNLPVTVSKLNALFSHFVDVYGDSLKPVPLPASTIVCRAPSLVC
jgi:hypothetical protein